MRKTVILLALALTGLALLLAGCPAEDGGRAGTETGVTLKNDGKLPAGFPLDLLKPYPGAAVTQSSANGADSMCSLTTTDSTQQVLDFYADHLANRGFTEQVTKDLGVGRLVKYVGPDCVVSVTAVDQDGSTLVNLVKSPIQRQDEATAGEAGLGNARAVVELPPDFPTDVIPPYAGWELNDIITEEDETTVYFHTKDNPVLVVDFYQAHFESLGMELSMEEQAREIRYLGFFGETEAIGMVIQPAGIDRYQVKITYDSDWERPEKYKQDNQ